MSGGIGIQIPALDALVSFKWFGLIEYSSPENKDHDLHFTDKRTAHKPLAWWATAHYTRGPLRRCANWPKPTAGYHHLAWAADKGPGAPGSSRAAHSAWGNLVSSQARQRKSRDTHTDCGQQPPTPQLAGGSPGAAHRRLLTGQARTAASGSALSPRPLSIALSLPLRG